MDMRQSCRYYDYPMITTNHQQNMLYITMLYSRKTNECQQKQQHCCSHCIALKVSLQEMDGNAAFNMSLRLRVLPVDFPLNNSIGLGVAPQPHMIQVSMVMLKISSLANC